MKILLFIVLDFQLKKKLDRIQTQQRLWLISPLVSPWMVDEHVDLNLRLYSS